MILNGCATVRQPTPAPVVPPSPPPADYKPVTGPATNLYIEAESALQAGRPADAEIPLERAIRIEPRNAHYWYTLAQVKYRQGKYRETVQLCLKAEALAGKQPQLVSLNKALMEQAKRAMQPQGGINN